MTLSASQRARNEELIVAALAAAGGKCYFCDTLIDTSVQGDPSWHQHTQPKIGNISAWRRHRNTSAFKPNLKSAPLHTGAAMISTTWELVVRTCLVTIASKGGTLISRGRRQPADTASEPRRVCRRLFGLSHAAIADVLIMA